MPHYQITSQQPATHYFEVRIRIDNPDPSGQQLRLPNWIPGSYMIRDFARNLIGIKAYCDGAEAVIEQIDKSNWRVEPCAGTLRIEYMVYAKDLSVRGAHLDHLHGYYNGTSVFLEVVGQSDQVCSVLIDKPAAPYCQHWKLATTLKAIEAEPFGFGLYQASDYDDLIDHPVEMGEFGKIRFEACGITHDVILSGRYRCDEKRLREDLTRICEYHIRFFGEPTPMDYYQFQVLVLGAGHGGLEHRASTSLICPRESLPQPGQAVMTDSYRDFLGLCSHEYFHSWNVKRIKPAVFQPYVLQQEVYTELLWAFEGITSYYDDLALRRCGVIDDSAYLELLAQTITRVERGLGSTRQSAAESSFNTWTKFYKQDENAANAIVSYYAKGCLIALCIDLKMRALSKSQQSLDDVMRQLWKTYLETGAGVEPDTIQKLVCAILDCDLTQMLNDMIQGTGPLPLAELLATVGIELKRNRAAGQNDKGGKLPGLKPPLVDFGGFVLEHEAGLKIQRVSEGGSAQIAGLSAEDVIIAVNGLKLTLTQFEAQLALAPVGEQWQIHAFRRDELYTFDVNLRAAALSTVFLEVTDTHQARRRAWLG